MKTNMKKAFLTAAAVLTLAVGARADEGMWLLPLLQKMNAQAMADLGCRLTPEQIYSINNTSLKDAIVHFGGGCTGEIISNEGLVITNHHCGYSNIQALSTPEHNYLEDGYWAMNRSEELPARGLSVTFLQSMTDVTDILQKAYDSSLKANKKAADKEELAQAAMEAAAEALAEKAEADNPHCTARVTSFYNNNVFYLIVYKTYTDIRFVGAPPASSGKFGGETDNWMWPRHTCDFSMFRVYAGPDNEPAAYSENNVPYRPKKSFKISRAGVKEGDFTFVYGCPGSTKEYAMSEDVRYVSEVSDPQKIALRTLRLDNMKKHMGESPAVRIQYSSKAASVSNAWKKWQGEAKGIDKNDVVNVKRDYERRFSEWAKGTRYDGLVEKLGELFARRNPYYLAYEYYTETARTIELLSFASSLRNAYPDADAVHSVAESFFKDYYQPIDEENFVAVMDAFDKKMPDEFKPAWFKDKLAELGSIEALRDYVFKGSLLTDKAGVMALTADDKDKVAADPALEMYDAFYRWYYDELRPVINGVNSEISLAYRDYMQGQMDFEKDKAFYPDANLTLRVAYGHVEGYSPADGVYYYPVSTLKGIIEKDNPDIFDYDIPQKLRDIYAEGGYESQPVCFLATNHTSGGNSGSPVINADGNLIGINFDRVWEGTMSDIVFDPEICRNISLDIRYLLFCIDRIGNASYLFDEMNFAD